MSTPAARRTITFDWTGVDTQTNDRKIKYDDLVSLVNYRRTVTGRLQKRVGHSVTSVTSFSGATHSGTPTEMAESDSHVIWRDFYGQFWALDETTGEGVYRGISQRAFPTYRRVDTVADSSPLSKPLIVLRDGKVWVFAKATANTYRYSIIDLSSGRAIKDWVSVTANGILAWDAFVDTGNSVWVVYVTNSTTIMAHVYTTEAGGAIATTYATQAGAAFVSVNGAANPSGTNVVVVALSSAVSGADRVAGIYRSYANNGVGTVVGSAYSTSTCAGGAAIQATSGITILDGPMTSGSYGIVYSRLKALDPTKLETCFSRVPVTNPAGAGETVVQTATRGNGYLVAAHGGYQLNFNYYEFWVSFRESGVLDNVLHLKSDAYVTNFVWDTGVVTTSTAALSATIASNAFSVNGLRYSLTHFDDCSYDGATADIGPGIQNGYWIRLSGVSLIAPILDGDTAGAFHNPAQTTGLQLAFPYLSHVIKPVVVGSKVYMALLTAGDTRTSPGVALVTVDMDLIPDVAGEADVRSTALETFSGGIPSKCSLIEPLSELAPIHYPYAPFSFSGAGPQGSYFVTYLYRITDSKGNITRSAPRPVSTTASALYNSSTLMVFPTLRHTVYGSKIEIEFYGSINGGTASEMYLQGVIANDANLNSVSVVVTPSSWVASGEILYTTGGGLENSSLPPARFIAPFGRRLVLWGTPDGSIWPSFEQVPGRGYEFNESLSFRLPDDSGTPVGHCELSEGVMAFFTAKGIYLASGAGPDGKGMGSYTVARVSTDKTAASPRALCRGPSGIYFQNRFDGRMCLLSAGGVTEINRGLESYITETIVSAIDCQAERVLRFYCASGRQLILDYAHPLSDQPFGQWYVHESTALLAAPAYDARLIDGEPVFLGYFPGSSQAKIWRRTAGVSSSDFTDNGTAVLTDLQSGRMQLAGFHGEFDTHMLTLSSEHRGGTSTYQYTLTGDDGAENHPDSPGSESDVCMVTGINRTREVRLRIRELTATGEGRSFDGGSLEVAPYGRVKLPQRQIG